MCDFLAVSYNQPKLSSCATWNSDAITFANESIAGTQRYGIFIDTNDTLYIPSYSSNIGQIWLANNDSPIINISNGLANPTNTFVTLSGGIFFDQSLPNARVDRWTLNATNSTTVMYVTNRCISLFVDRNNDLYCSALHSHQVVKKSLYDDINSSSIIAGTGAAGSTSTQLNNPRGIFIDTNFNLYVADMTNDRIQFFQPGFRNGTTIVGNGANGTITIDGPISIVLDADGYLYIAEYNTHRIVGSSRNGFRCVAGCTGASGSAADQLYHPWGLAFDSYGNLFVVDQDNQRVQKFLLAMNFCSEYLLVPHILAQFHEVYRYSR